MESPVDANRDGNPADDMAQREADERRRILLAATEVLQRNGWWGFKVESVLRQAGLSTRSFYRHFEKKSDLVLALLESEVAEATISLRRAVDAVDTPSEKVRAYGMATIDFAYQEHLSKPSSLFASHWREMLPEHPEVMDRCIQRLLAPLEEAIKGGAAMGEFHSPDPVADSRALFFLLFGITADQITVGGLMPRAQVEQIVMPFLSRAIGLN